MLPRDGSTKTLIHFLLLDFSLISLFSFTTFHLHFPLSIIKGNSHHCLKRLAITLADSFIPGLERMLGSAAVSSGRESLTNSTLLDLGKGSKSKKPLRAMMSTLTRCHQPWDQTTKEPWWFSVLASLVAMPLYAVAGIHVPIITVGKHLEAAPF